MYKDKTLVCSGCKQEFVFSASEQQLFAERGFESDPKLCPACRAIRAESRKNQFNPDTGSLIVCALCGSKVTVNFKIPKSRVIYCRKCYAKVCYIPKEGEESIGS